MNTITRLALFAIPLSLSLQAKADEGIEWRKIGLQYSITDTSIDKKLKTTEAVFDLTFKTSKGVTITQAIKLSYNKTEKTVTPDKNGHYSLKLSPGNYTFQFWYNDQHSEIFTSEITIKAQNHIALSTHFQSSTESAVCFKPVIYLYPQHSTPVNVKLEIKNAFDFTYPAYNHTEGWSVTAHADGTLQQGDKTYGYLFWEGPTEIATADLQKQEGFVVEASALTGFFEEKLAQLGLNGKEIQDYITYWVPRLQTEPRHFIRFLINEDFNRYATLTITPKPDHVLRVFMLSTPLNANENINVKAQTLPAFTREGFTVVEWGGTVVTLPTATNK